MDAAAGAGSETAEAATDAAGGGVSSCLPQAANNKGRHIGGHRGQNQRWEKHFA